MTTKITIDTHAGLPVEVKKVDSNGKEEWIQEVKPFTIQDFYVYDGVKLIITELKINK